MPSARRRRRRCRPRCAGFVAALGRHRRAAFGCRRRSIPRCAGTRHRPPPFARQSIRGAACAAGVAERRMQGAASDRPTASGGDDGALHRAPLVEDRTRRRLDEGAGHARRWDGNARKARNFPLQSGASRSRDAGASNLLRRAPPPQYLSSFVTSSTRAVMSSETAQARPSRSACQSSAAMGCGERMRAFSSSMRPPSSGAGACCRDWPTPSPAPPVRLAG